MELVLMTVSWGGLIFTLRNPRVSRRGGRCGAQGNHDDSDSDLHSVFSQIARDEQRNERKKQVNADQEKRQAGIIEPGLESNTPSENESENTPVEIPHLTTQPFYLQPRHNRLESETPSRPPNTNYQNHDRHSNHERVQKNNRTNVAVNNKEALQSSSRKRKHAHTRQLGFTHEESQTRNHDRTRQSGSVHEESLTRQPSPEPLAKNEHANLN